MRVLFGLALVLAVVIAGCSSNSNDPNSNLNTGTGYYPYPPTGTGTVTCSAMSGFVNGNQISVSVYAQGGSAPYSVVQMSVNGAPVQVSGATQFTGSTTVTGFMTTGATGGTGSVTVLDAYGMSGNCSFSTTGGGYPTPTPNPSGVCQVAFSQNPIVRGSSVDVFAYTTTSAYAGTLQAVYGPTGYGISGQVTGANSARLSFPYPGQFLLTLYMSSGGNCQGYITVQ